MEAKSVDEWGVLKVSDCGTIDALAARQPVGCGGAKCCAALRQVLRMRLRCLRQVYTACPDDPKTLFLDVRPQKDFKRGHLALAYCVRLSANGAALLDYSQASYSLPWSTHCW